MKAGNKCSLPLRQEVHTVTVQRKAGVWETAAPCAQAGKEEDRTAESPEIDHSDKTLSTKWVTDTEILWIKVNRKQCRVNTQK